MPWTRAQPNFGTRLELEIAELREQLVQKEETLANWRLKKGDRGVCPVTLTDHATVTYHSAAPAERHVCIDCNAKFRDDDSILTRPHNRSRM